MIREAERMIALEARLPALIRREEHLATGSERIRLARLCQIKHLFATSAADLGRAFQPPSPDSPSSRAPGIDTRPRARRYVRHRGESKENPPPDRAARERLRRKAREWLEADLAAVIESMEKGSPRERSSGPSRLGRWLVASQLDGVRDQAKLLALSETERRDWKAFWIKVDNG